MPLMFSTSIATGGLGLSPFDIGVILAVWGCLNALIQILFTARILRRFGERRVFITSMIVFLVGTFAFSFESFAAKTFGRVNALVWMLLCIHLGATFLISTGLGLILRHLIRHYPLIPS